MKIINKLVKNYEKKMERKGREPYLLTYESHMTGNVKRKKVWYPKGHAKKVKNWAKTGTYGVRGLKKLKK